MSIALQNGKASATQTQTGLADIFSKFGDAYQKTHYLTLTQRKAVRAITVCRTAALGGHRDWCQRCGFERYLYHSCRNRHCPKCQSLVKAKWLSNRERELLPVPYFHNIFTLPHEFNALILWNEQNRRLLLNLLFQAASATLLTFGKNNLGGKIGFTMILHTWDQQLRPHFHVHALIASGAISDDGERWIAGGREYLFPVRALSQVFRAKYLEGVAALLANQELQIPTTVPMLSSPQGCRRWLRRLRKKRWVIYSKRPFSGPKKLLDYLGRYTHRVAISDHRIISCESDQVRFKYRDRRDNNRCKVASLSTDGFITRFLLHVLPNGFRRVRHYGYLANRNKRRDIARCRELLGVRKHVVDEEEQPKTVADWMLFITGLDVTCCPSCGGPLSRESLPLPGEMPTPKRICPQPWDTS